MRPVLLSGGSGTRLWPLSTHERPKQFVPLFDGRSLFDLTLARLDGIANVPAPIVVTGAAHRDLVKSALQARGVENAQIVVEPIGRNTAPAAIAAALISEPDDVMVILPSDHLIAEVGGFQQAVGLAADHARDRAIITFGIEPTRPETGYGYIEIGDHREPGAFEVSMFKEKPSAEVAREMVADGRHVWNSGMFVTRSDHLLHIARLHCPEMVEGVQAALPSGDGGVHALGASFGEVDADSIDYAIMEKTDSALVIPIDVGWDDVGSYHSLLAAVTRDSDGNHIEGEVTLQDVTGSFISATSRTVAVAGMSDVVVVETPDAVLVVPLDRSQEVRDLARRVDRD